MSVFLTGNFQFLVVKCSIYLNRRVFVMRRRQRRHISIKCEIFSSFGIFTPLQNQVIFSFDIAYRLNPFIDLFDNTETIQIYVHVHEVNVI